MKPKPNYKLKAEITRRGYWLKDFAVKAGVHPKTLSLVITGRYLPTDAIEKKIAKALRMSRKKLFQ
ncbi:MAG: helix-turn-helix transcriptional regulator [Candidatus Omnitrophica bacterium]|nr:helix-turn-helix transcriptional regulator [Candidatus Omnitrophota bacterium]